MSSNIFFHFYPQNTLREDIKGVAETVAEALVYGVNNNADALVALPDDHQIVLVGIDQDRNVTVDHLNRAYEAGYSPSAAYVDPASGDTPVFSSFEELEDLLAPLMTVRSLFSRY